MVLFTRRGEPPSRGGLPSGYTQLSYIESSGSQYIKTGFIPNQDTRVLAEIFFPAPTGSTSTYMFGSRLSSSSRGYTFHGISSTYESVYDAVGGKCYTGVINEKFIIDKNKNVTTCNGQTTTQTAATFTCPGELYLFSLNNNGSSYHPATAKLYSCKIYDNGTLIRDFVPCINPQNQVGLYDLVTKEFYGNSGTGSFVGS